LEVGRARIARVALLSVSLSALTAGSPALAQPVNWTGFYAGFYAGGVFGRSKSKAGTDCPPFDGGVIGGYFCDSTLPDSQANANGVTSAASGKASSTGFTGGIQLGQNWQIGSFVYGLEGDFGAFRIRTSRSASGVYSADTFIGLTGNTFTVTNQAGTDWLLTARGRVGWTVSNWLIYATGGLAMSRVSVINSFSDTAIGADQAAVYSKIKFGWTVGGGMEVALTRNWSVKGEYLYVDLGSVDTSGTIRPSFNLGYSNALGVSTSLTAHVARLGANYKF
jgi:outer membrane immunogenic protein